MSSYIRFYLYLIFFASLLVSGCDNGKDYGLCHKSFDPSEKEVVIHSGTQRNFSVDIGNCDQGKEVSYHWFLGEESLKNDGSVFDFFACAYEIGGHQLKVEIYIEDELFHVHTWDITVETGGVIERPAEVLTAISDIRSGGNFGYEEEKTIENRQKFAAARDLLHPYLESNACDMEAKFAYAFASMIMLLSEFESRFLFGSLFVTPLKLMDIIEEFENDIVSPLEMISLYAGEEFTFKVDFLNILLLQDYLDLGFGDVLLFLDGEYDMADVHFILSGMDTILGGLETALAYNGMVEYVNFFSTSALIKKLEEDPGFLELADEGEDLLAGAKKRFVESIDNALMTISFILQEEDDQSDDILRYWDCGIDGVCPGDPSEVPDGYTRCGPDVPYTDYNHNGKCNLAYTAPDEGEGNGQYEFGEPLGTDRVRVGSYDERYTIALNDYILDALKYLKLNIQGPDALDYDELAGLPKGTVRAILETFAIPYPEIRLSEFFDNPSSLRMFIPLYDINDHKFIIEQELEPFEDVGIDQTPNNKESNYDPTFDPDPNHDNLDLSCDGPLSCNINDGYDNDYDGLVDNEDTWIGMSTDAGLEGNGMFDYVELCAPEGYTILDSPCTITMADGRSVTVFEFEPFEDVGVGVSAIGRGDKVFTMEDIDHTYPAGTNVGGAPTEVSKDPKNGIYRDEGGRLIDLFYLFFPDPTFSKVIIFPNPVINTDGKTLTNNAVLHRFVFKVFWTAGDLKEAFDMARAAAYAGETLDINDIISNLRD